MKFYMGKDLNDQRFFEEVVWPHYEYISKLVYTITLDCFLANEITQETMAAAWKNIEKLKSYKQLSAALRQMAMNTLYTHYRKNNDILLGLGTMENFEDVPVESNINDYVNHEGNLRDIRFLFNEMRDEHLQVVLLCDYYELPLKIVAKFLGLNYNTAASYHKRALEHMRAKRDGTEYSKDHGKGGQNV